MIDNTVLGVLAGSLISSLFFMGLYHFKKKSHLILVLFGTKIGLIPNYRMYHNMVVSRRKRY